MAWTGAQAPGIVDIGGSFGVSITMLARFAPSMNSGSSHPTVLHYTGYDDDTGGIMTVVRNLAWTGRFECVLGVNPRCEQRRAPPLPVLELPALDGERIELANFWRAHRTARAVRAWLKEEPGRIFHGHSRAGLLVGMWLHWMGEKRVVVSVHCFGRQRWFYRWAHRRLHGNLFWLSPAMRSYYGVAGTGWAHCIPGGVVAAPATPRSVSQSGALRLGGMGALVAWKRWNVVVEAIAQAVQAGVNVTFEHVGGGDESLLRELQRQAQQRGIVDRIRFCGHEMNQERLFGEIDALVIASENEPFSMAMLEALAAGIPVVAADSGGALDVIKDGLNGRLYRTGDSTALATVLHEMLLHPPKWDAEAIRGTASNINDIAAQWAEIYAKL